jgi:branched-chain amino acid transport system ATP-binding protein
VNVLDYDGVRAYYGDALILDGLSFRVPEGGCHALVGPNGVGKTTSLNAMYGIARLGQGEVRIDGTPVRTHRGHHAASLGAGLVPQGRWIIASLTV